MGIKRGQHAIDGRFDQLAVIGLFDIVGPDLFEHIAEQVELAIDVPARGNGRRPDLGMRHKGGCYDTEHHAGEEKRNFAHHPRTFSVRGGAHQGAGSMEVPSLRNST